MKLSEHFTLEELTASDIGARKGLDNTPNEQEVANLVRLAAFLEQVRTLLGKPILINSAFRSEAVNRAVGSKDTSQHRKGCAADIRAPGMTPKEVCTKIVQSKLHYDQVICEFDAWTHVSIPNKPEIGPRKVALGIDKNGTRSFEV